MYNIFTYWKNQIPTPNLTIEDSTPVKILDDSQISEYSTSFYQYSRTTLDVHFYTDDKKLSYLENIGSPFLDLNPAYSDINLFQFFVDFNFFNNVTARLSFDFKINLLESLLLFIGLLLSVAFSTVSERRFLGSLQRRRGPEVVGFWGLLQAIADAVKLLTKEIFIPSSSTGFLFRCTPYISILVALYMWPVIPFSENGAFMDVNLGLLFLYAMLSLHVYSVIFAGWASNSIYAFLGSLRCAAQMISYEVSLGLLFLCISIIHGNTMSLSAMVKSQSYMWLGIAMFPFFILFFAVSIAESNRAPFDLPEAESELVSGYNTEYSGVYFAFFFIGEYCHILLMCALMVVMFWGGWDPIYIFNIPILHEASSLIIFSIKILVLFYLFVLVRASLPRYRYDQLMQLGWKIFLPISISLFFLVSVYHMSYIFW